MRKPERIVIDTNVLVSRLLLPQSVPAQAVRLARRRGLFLVSEATMYELAEVLARNKFDRYITIENRRKFLRQLRSRTELVPIIQLVRDCRDPDDDKILEVALNGRADVIITGDDDLLALNPWREIAIVSSAEYLRD